MLINENEIWKPVVGYEGLYEVSSMGRVRSCDKEVWNRFTYILRKGKLMEQGMDDDGYCTITLCKESKKSNCHVHRLVAMAFIDNPMNLPEVNHKDSIRHNNRAENLEWVTAQGNHDHAKVKGRFHYEYLEKPVVQIDPTTNKVIQVYRSIVDANSEHGFHIGNIALCCKGYKDTHAGFAWKYDNGYNVGDTIYVPPKRSHSTRKRPVAKLSMDNVVLDFYESLTEAAEANDCHNSAISMCCKGKLNQHHGYKWAYSNSNMKLNQKWGDPR